MWTKNLLDKNLTYRKNNEVACISSQDEFEFHSTLHCSHSKHKPIDCSAVCFHLITSVSAFAPVEQFTTTAADLLFRNQTQLIAFSKTIKNRTI